MMYVYIPNFTCINIFTEKIKNMGGLGGTLISPGRRRRPLPIYDPPTPEGVGGDLYPNPRCQK